MWFVQFFGTVETKSTIRIILALDPYPYENTQPQPIIIGSFDNKTMHNLTAYTNFVQCSDR